jgi:hypothetical protein
VHVPVNRTQNSATSVGAITSRIDKQVYKVTMISFVCQYVKDRWEDTLVYLSETRMGVVIMLKPLVMRRCNYSIGRTLSFQVFSRFLSLVYNTTAYLRNVFSETRLHAKDMEDGRSRSGKCITHTRDPEETPGPKLLIDD